MSIETMIDERLQSVHALLNVCLAELQGLKRLEKLSVVTTSTESAAAPDAGAQSVGGVTPSPGHPTADSKGAPSPSDVSPGAAAVSTSVDSPATPAESNPGATPGEALPSPETVRAAVITYTRKHGADKARALLKQVGGTDMLPDVPAEKTADVLAAFEAANKEG